MKLTESKLRSIIREELNEMGSGDEYAIYYIKDIDVNAFSKREFHPSSYALEKIKTGSLSELQDYAERKIRRRSWEKNSSNKRTYYIDLFSEKKYVIDTNAELAT